MKSTLSISTPHSVSSRASLSQRTFPVLSSFTSIQFHYLIIPHHRTLALETYEVIHL